MWSPGWLTRCPRLEFVEKKYAVTADAIAFRDRWGRIWTIPERFPTDGMSYPWPIKIWRDRYDQRTLQAAIMHDFLYVMHDYIDGWPCRRAMADLMFLDGLYEIAAWRRRLYYTAVRIAGRPVWDHKRYDDYMADWIFLFFGPF